MQKEELTATRKVLELQKNELSLTRLEFSNQNQTLRIQRFENTFFEMLKLHHEIVNGMEKKYSDQIHRGREVFKIYYNNYIKRKGISSNRDYLKAYKEVNVNLGHYFRNLYRIVKLIDSTEFVGKDEITNDKEGLYEKANFEERYKYTSIVRSQISDYELYWLFYNCLSVKGNEKFKPLIERYCLLKILNDSNEVSKDFEMDGEKYDISAFSNVEDNNYESE